MLFKDLKAGDRFISKSSIEDGMDEYGILIYIKLRDPVNCHTAFMDMTKNLSTKKDMQHFLETFSKMHPYTAIVENGMLVRFPDDAPVLKLNNRVS